MLVAGEKRVLVAAEREEAFRLVERVLAPLGYDVAWISSADRLVAAVRTTRIDLVVLDGTADLAGFRRFGDVLLGSNSRLPVLSLLRVTSLVQLAELMRDYQLTSFLGCAELAQLDEVELMSTATKILEGNFFGIGRYLGPISAAKAFTLRRSADRHAVIDAAEAFAVEAGCGRHVASNYATVADELLTNALYNAPTGPDGRQRFATLERSTPIELDEAEAVFAEFGFDGRRLAVGVADTFGSLPAETALAYLHRCLARAEMHDPSTSGGAGLGLYQVFRSVHHLIIGIARGQRTETIGLIETSASFRAYAKREKSFNLFVASTVR